MKNKVSLVGMFGIILAFGIMIIGCKDSDPEPKTKIVKYQVTSTQSGKARYTINYYDPSSGYGTLKDVIPPWEKTFSAPSNSILSVNARVNDNELFDGYITAKIFIDGIEVRSETRSGSVGVQFRP